MLRETAATRAWPHGQAGAAAQGSTFYNQLPAYNPSRCPAAWITLERNSDVRPDLKIIIVRISQTRRHVITGIDTHFECLPDGIFEPSAELDTEIEKLSK